MKEDFLYVTLDVNIADHPDIIGLSAEAKWAFVAGLCYAKRHLTDGFLPYAWALVQAGAAGELVAAGRWAQCDGGYRIEHYARWNFTRAEVEEIRHAHRKGGRTRVETAKRDGQGQFEVADGVSEVAEKVADGLSEVSEKVADVAESDTNVADSGVRRVAGHVSGHTQNRRSHQVDPAVRTSCPPAVLQLVEVDVGVGEDDTSDSSSSNPSSASRTDGSKTSGFEEFYAAYPRHEKRRRAESAYKKALGRTNAATILAGAQRLAGDPNLPKGQERQYVPHPASWLNADGWADDPLPERLGARGAPARDRASEIFAMAQAARDVDSEESTD